MFNLTKSVVYNKRSNIFYLSKDYRRKFVNTKKSMFCSTNNSNNAIMQDILFQLKKFDSNKLNSILEGKYYEEHKAKIMANSEVIEASESTNTTNSTNLFYNPYSELEKSVNIEEIDYSKLNTYSYFLNYSIFLQMLNSPTTDADNPYAIDTKLNTTDTNTNPNNTIETKDTINTTDTKTKTKIKTNTTNQIDVKTYIECLCKMYIGHNIHYKIKEEISKKTNLYILKGDYFFSLGYYTVCKIGNPSLIKYYSKISENFAQSIFENLPGSSRLMQTNKEQMFVSKFGWKFVSFIYLGCLGIKELINIQNTTNQKEIIKEFTLKFGMLVYLKEELNFLKDKNPEYVSSFEDTFHSFVVYTSKLVLKTLPSKMNKNEKALKTVSSILFLFLIF